MHDVIIIGAGTAGLTAAIYARRANKSVLVLEGEAFGGQITFAPRVENFPGTMQMSGAEFADRLVEQALALGAEIEFESVVGLRQAREDEQGWVVLGEYQEYPCLSVIIATGQKHRELGLPNEHDIEGVSYCALCDGAFYKSRQVCVVGGGSAALQEALYLSGLCHRVYVVHRRDRFRGEAYLQEALERCKNVVFVMNSVVEALLGDTQVETLRLRNVEDDFTSELHVNGLFVAVGQVPQNAAFADTVTLSGEGYIIAGEDCQTSAEGVYAAGDCRTKDVRQLTTAAADGAVAAVAACRRVDRLRQG
jgi:thioredoxin reductase (NADPH)